MLHLILDAISIPRKRRIFFGFVDYVSIASHKKMRNLSAG